MKSKMVKKLVILGVLGLLVGCSNGKTDNDLTEKSIVNQGEKKAKIVHDIIEMPDEEEIEGKDEYKMVDQLITERNGKPLIVSRLSNKKKDALKLRYKVSELQSDNTWKTYVAPWSDKCDLHDLLSTSTIKCAPNGKLYALMLRLDWTHPVIRQLGEDGEVFDISLGDIEKKYPDRFPTDMYFIDDSRVVLALNTRKNNSPSGIEMEDDESKNKRRTILQVYNLVENKMEKENEYYSFTSMNFDSHLMSYTYNPEHDCITVKKIGEKIADRTIKCGLHEYVDHPKGNQVREIKTPDNENGYILTPFGIMGGKLDANKWEWIVDREDLVLKGDEEIIKQMSAEHLELHNADTIIKGEESEYDFYRLLEYRGKKTTRKFWVYYHEKN